MDQVAVVRLGQTNPNPVLHYYWTIFPAEQSYLRTPRNRKERMVRPWVDLAHDQYQQLKELGENTGESLSGTIREVAPGFVRKKNYPRVVACSSLSRGTSHDYRTVTARFLGSDWNLFAEISRKTRA